MLSALKPNESAYDITKFYKKISRINLLKKHKNLINKISLPKLSNKILEPNLVKSLSNSGKNSFKIHKIDLNYINNFQNNLRGFNDNNILKNKQALSENNTKLPEVYKKKNYFSNNNSPKKSNTNYNCLYLKYEGNDNDHKENSNKIYIKINPDKIFRSLRHIIKNNENLINNLGKTINKIMVDKYTSMTNSNRNSSSDFKTIEVDYNEIVKSVENKYILLTENNNNKNKHLFKIKNVFLENIIKNVITHTVEIRNKKNQIILKEDLEDELNNQLDLLKKFFIHALNGKNRKKLLNKNEEKKTKITKIIEIKKHLLKTYNNILFHNFDETGNMSIMNKISEGNLTERNNRNMKIFNVFKKQLSMTKYESIHTLYNNIVNYKNCFSQNDIKSGDKKKNELNKIKKVDDDINNKKTPIFKFYKKYQRIKDDLNLNNINKENNNKYIFDLGPNLKLVEFDEIINEINDMTINNKNNNNKINNEMFFLKMISRKSVLGRINFNNIKNKNLYKIFRNENNKGIIPRKKIYIKSKRNLQFDILKKIGEKLHKTIKIKVGRNKKERELDSSSDTNQTDYIKKINKEKYSEDSLLTENRRINTDTNSSVYSDIPGNFNMSDSELKREKEEKSKKLKEIIGNKNIFNETSISDIDELFFNKKIIKDNDKDEKMINKEDFNNKEKDLKNKEDDIINYNDIKNKKSDDNKKMIDINMSNILIKNKIKKRKIKYTQSNDSKEKINSNNTNNTNLTNKTLGNIKSVESNKPVDKQQSNVIINKKDNNSPTIKNNQIKEDKKENQNQDDMNNKSNLIKKEKILVENEEKNKNLTEQKIINQRVINKNRFKDEKNYTNKRFHKKRNKSKIKEFNYNEDNKSEKGTSRKNIEDENEINKHSYEELMDFFNDKFNIPGESNKIKYKKIFYKSFSEKMNYNLSSHSTFSEKYYSITKTKININNEIDKEELKTNKSFSFIDTRNDKKLILVKPLLNHILSKKNTNKKQIRDSVNKFFRVAYISLTDINTNEKEPNKYDMRRKRKTSLDNYENFENKKNYRILKEKYFISDVIIEQKRYKDDDDISVNFSKNFMRNKIFKKKVDKKKGFKDLIDGFDVFENDKLWLDNFENNKRENDILRNIIKAKREKKRKHIEEAENKFNIFKSYINNLKNMTEEQFKHDAIRFVFKEETDQEKLQISNRVKRINEFKKYLKINELNKLNNNKSILKAVLFRPNCVFHTDKNFKI